MLKSIVKCEICTSEICPSCENSALGKEHGHRDVLVGKVYLDATGH